MGTPVLHTPFNAGGVFCYCLECESLAINREAAVADYARMYPGQKFDLMAALQKMRRQLAEDGFDAGTLLIVSDVEWQECGPGVCLLNVRHFLPHIIRRLVSWN